MNITMNSRVVKQRYLSLLAYSHALNAQRIHIFRDSGSMSATVGACLQQWAGMSATVGGMLQARSTSCMNMNVVSIYCNHN